MGETGSKERKSFVLSYGAMKKKPDTTYYLCVPPFSLLARFFGMCGKGECGGWEGVGCSKDIERLRASTRTQKGRGASVSPGQRERAQIIFSVDFDFWALTVFLFLAPSDDAMECTKMYSVA